MYFLRQENWGKSCFASYQTKEYLGKAGKIIPVTSSLKLRFSPDRSKIFFSEDFLPVIPPPAAVDRIPLNLHPALSHGLRLHSRLQKLPSLQALLRPFLERIPAWNSGLLCPLSQSKQGGREGEIKRARRWGFLNMDKWRVSFASRSQQPGWSQTENVKCFGSYLMYSSGLLLWTGLKSSWQGWCIL